MMNRVQGWLTRGVTEDQHRRMVDFIRETTAGIDPQLAVFLIAHQIPLSRLVPKWMKDACAMELFQYFDLVGLPDEEKLRAAVEARPDVADVLQTELGRAWLRRLFTEW